MTLRTLYATCPLCDSLDIVYLRDGDCSGHEIYNPALPAIIRWMTCSECQHVFADGYWSEDALKALFEKTHEYQKPGYELEKCRQVWAATIDKITPLMSRGRWLDVGFGNGGLLFTAAEYGYRTTGIDLRQSTVDAMNQIGIEAHCCDITDFNQETKFDIISMMDVLEHTHHPRAVLQAARNLMVPDGVLLISMPNMGCASWQKYDVENRNPYWGEIEHYHNFTRDRLYKLLLEIGFEPASYGVSKRYIICMEVIARAL